MNKIIFLVLLIPIFIFTGCNQPVSSNSSGSNDNDNGIPFDKNTIIYEGEGIDEIKVHDHYSKIVQLFGECNNKVINGNVTWWNYIAEYNIDFLVDNNSELIIEFRFNNGFPGKTENNIKIGTLLNEVLTKHGGANGTFIVLTQVEANNNPNGTDKVLYEVSTDGGTTITNYKFIDSNRGICYWIDNAQAVVQIVVF